MQVTKLFLPESAQLALPLDARTREYVQHAKSANTTRAYRSAFLDFSQFCRGRGVPALPATPQIVMDYLITLADTGRKAATLQVRLAAISFAHHAAHAPDPTQDDAVKILMQGIRRKIGTAPAQKNPVTRDVLQQLVDAETNDLRGIRNKAMFLLAFAGAFRRSELIALDVADIQIGTREMIVRVRRSKTDQEGRSLKKRIPLLNANPALCPVRAVQTWMRAADILRGPLFRAIDRWGHVRKTRMSDRDLALFVKSAARRAGLDSTVFAGHSFRAGFVTQAASDNVPEWEIQRVTTHKSGDVLRRYIRDEGIGQSHAIGIALGENAK